MVKRVSIRALSLAACAGLIPAALACPFCHQVRSYIVGDTMDMGNGTARTWVHIDKDGKPDQVGITLTETALEGLQTAKPDNGMDGYEFTLKLPKEASILPFDHIGIDWNPKGHTPAPIYTVPHFDFHFYMITPAERMTIDPAGEGMKLCQKKPAPTALPKDYIYAPDSEIKYMGSHWVDVNTPELHGKPFTQTFIYGSYNGKVAFIEPMITMEYLKSKPNVSYKVPQPQKLNYKGKMYPTKYHIRYLPDRKEYQILLDGFVKA